MNFRNPLLLLSSLALLAACGGAPASSSSSGTTEQSTSSTPSSQSSASSASSGQEQPSSSEEKTQSESSEEKPSSIESMDSSSSSSKQSESESSSSSSGHQSNAESSSNSQEESSSIDLEGLVEVAYAPEGVVLTDWTSDMKTILSDHLGGHIPPFMWLENLRVSFDNLDILQARGDSYDGVCEDYINVLTKAGYQAYAEAATSGTRVYGRIFLDTGAIYIDALDANGMFSINFERDGYLSAWPSDGIQSIVSTEYESSTVVPAFVADNYIVESDILSNIFILCLGENVTADSVDDYAALLEANNWTVVAMEGEYEGYMTAMSRDALVIMTFYWDGAGVMIEITHGEGEIYADWDSVVPALEDFAKKDLGLEGLSTPIPSFDEGDRYEIDRSAKGWLKVQVSRDSANVTATMMEAYVQKCVDAGFRIDRSKPDEFGVLAYAPDESYVLSIFITEDTDEYGGDADRLEICLIGPISITHYVFYEWPETRLAWFLSNINASQATVLSIDVEGATYYANRDVYGTSLDIIIKGVPSDILPLYKSALERYDYTVVLEGNALNAVDSKKLITIDATLSEDTLTVVFKKYVAPLADNTISFATKGSLSESDAGWAYAIWGGSPFSFRVDKGNGITVGNYGDYVNNPLRMFKGQTITITPEEGKTVKSVTFYSAAVTQAAASYKFNVSNAGRLTSDKATFDAEASVAGLNKYVYTVDANAGESIVFQMPSDGSFGLDSVKVVLEG